MMTQDPRRTEIEWIIREIAALLGDKPELEIKLPGRGVVRIQTIQSTRVRPGQFHDYPGWDAALEAARIAHRRAQKIAAARKAAVR